MSDELKYEMQRWFNVDPNMDYLPFDSYLEMAIRNSEAELFRSQFFRPLAKHADQQYMMLKRLSDMRDAAINPPIVLKTMEDADVIEQRKQFDRAIELLEACSEDLFISGDDKELETQIDVFLKENKA